MGTQGRQAESLPVHTLTLPTLVIMSTGYSGTPLPRKLGVSAGSRVLVLGQPVGTDLGSWECRARHTRAGKSPYDVVLVFAPNLATLRRRIAPAIAAATTAGRLWICWPKGSSGVPSDLTENVVRDIGLAEGVVDVKVCAIDDTWSGLAFVRRLRDR